MSIISGLPKCWACIRNQNCDEIMNTPSGGKCFCWAMDGQEFRIRMTLGATALAGAGAECDIRVPRPGVAQVEYRLKFLGNDQVFVTKAEGAGRFKIDGELVQSHVFTVPFSLELGGGTLDFSSEISGEDRGEDSNHASRKDQHGIRVGAWTPPPLSELPIDTSRKAGGKWEPAAFSARPGAMPSLHASTHIGIMLSLGLLSWTVYSMSIRQPAVAVRRDLERSAVISYQEEERRLLSKRSAVGELQRLYENEQERTLMLAAAVEEQKKAAEESRRALDTIPSHQPLSPENARHWLRRMRALPEPKLLETPSEMITRDFITLLLEEGVGEIESGRAQSEAWLGIAEQAAQAKGEEEMQVHARVTSGLALTKLDKLQEARGKFETALSTKAVLAVPVVFLHANLGLAGVELKTGNYDACIEHAEAARVAAAKQGDRMLEAVANELQGRACLSAGRKIQGWIALEDASEIHRRLGNWQHQSALDELSREVRESVKIEFSPFPQEGLVSEREARDITSFIHKLVRAENSQQIDRVEDYYANQVDYFDKGMIDRNELLTLKGADDKGPPFELQKVVEPMRMRSFRDGLTRLYQVDMESEGLFADQEGGRPKIRLKQRLVLEYWLRTGFRILSVKAGGVALDQAGATGLSNAALGAAVPQTKSDKATESRQPAVTPEVKTPRRTMTSEEFLRKARALQQR